MAVYDKTQGKVNVLHSVWFCVYTTCKTKMYTHISSSKHSNLLTPYIFSI